MAKYTLAPTQVALSTTTARSAALPKGTYRITTTASCFYRQGGSGVTAAATDHYLPSTVERFVEVTHGTDDAYIAGILSAGTGTLVISLVEGAIR